MELEVGDILIWESWSGVTTRERVIFIDGDNIQTQHIKHTKFAPKGYVSNICWDSTCKERWTVIPNILTRSEIGQLIYG